MGPRAAGVFLVLTATYAGGWTDISTDTNGRAISANVALRDDSQVRMTAAYGVSGTCCPNFSSFPAQKQAEVRLTVYITSQARLCQEK